MNRGPYEETDWDQENSTDLHLNLKRAKMQMFFVQKECIDASFKM